MPLFDDLGKKIAKTGQDVVKGTKDFTESARLSSQIADEQKQIGALYAQLGKLYYDTNGQDAQEPMALVCRQIKDCLDRISQCETEIARIKGIKKCVSCGADIPVASAFCGNCGTTAPQAPEPEKPAGQFCRNCGVAIAADAAFCTSCGFKQ